MEREFKNPEVARFFNQNFVNVRINMEKEKAKDYELEYQIVFLPTMIFVTPEGRVLTKMDRIVPANELLSIGKLFSNQPNSPPVASNTSRPTTRSSKPPVVKKAQTIPRKTEETKVAKPVTAPKKKEAAIVTQEEDEGKILYVMGQGGDNLPPEILKEEAYFRMQLMDGSHQEAATKFIQTQTDWLTEDNVKFLHDFLDDARSENFEFLINNKSRFESVIGPELISQTINILVNKELERAYPRPDLERATTLYTYADRTNPQLKAQAYHLNKSLKQSLVLAERAVDLDSDEALYHFNKANVAMLLKNRRVALEAANQALSLTKSGDDKKKIAKLLEQIELL